MDVDLSMLAALASAAQEEAPGDWVWCGGGHLRAGTHQIVVAGANGLRPASDAVSTYIAAMDPTTVLALLAEIDRLRAALGD